MKGLMLVIALVAAMPSPLPRHTQDPRETGSYAEMRAYQGVGRDVFMTGGGGTILRSGAK